MPAASFSAQVSGGWRWPAVSWAPRLCDRRDAGELLASKRPASQLLVRFYGEHSHMWVSAQACRRPPEDEAPLLAQLAAWGRTTHQ